MTKNYYLNLLLEKGEEKVPHNYVLDILCLLIDKSLNAKMTKLDGNYTLMTLI